MRLRHHPRPIDLGAWFDGEAAPGVGGHVAWCRHCQGQLADLGEIRAWTRAQPFFAMHDANPVIDSASRYPAAAMMGSAFAAALLAAPRRRLRWLPARLARARWATTAIAGWR